MNQIGTISLGIKTPIVKEGDDIQNIIIESINKAMVENHLTINDDDIIGITESLIARSQGNYVNTSDIIRSIKEIVPGDQIILYEPIASRNRFSFILKAICQAYSHIQIIWQHSHDEVGNILNEKHPFTGICYKDFYKQIANESDCELEYLSDVNLVFPEQQDIIIDCRCHCEDTFLKYTLKDVCKDKCEYGLLGSNIAEDNRLKLFPTNCQYIVDELQAKINKAWNVNMHVMIYADGCFKDPIGGIWEFADPVTSPAYTKGLEGTPHEFKLKYLADTIGEEGINKAFERIHSEQKVSHEGTTPRRYVDLLASLMDLTSGSGDKGTPIVLVKNYFKTYAD